MEQFKSDPGGIPEPDFRSGESNRDLATRWFREVWNERRSETIDELWAPGGMGHTENGDQGMAEFKAAREGLPNAFPAKYVVGAGLVPARSAADGDDVVVRWRARGTPFAVMASACPRPGAPSTFGMTSLTFRNGVIVEGWDSWNLSRLLIGRTLTRVFRDPISTPDRLWLRAKGGT